jgi:hypothetical protein
MTQEPLDVETELAVGFLDYLLTGAATGTPPVTHGS